MMNTRKLKVEKTGDSILGKIKPAIRLKGNWLERAGFRPNTHCQIVMVAPGKLEIQAIQP